MLVTYHFHYICNLIGKLRNSSNHNDSLATQIITFRYSGEFQVWFSTEIDFARKVYHHENPKNRNITNNSIFVLLCRSPSLEKRTFGAWNLLLQYIPDQSMFSIIYSSTRHFLVNGFQPTTKLNVSSSFPPLIFT